MKIIRSLAIVAGVSVIAAGISVISRNRVASQSEPSPTPAPIVKTSPTPNPTPNRALKPNEKFIAAIGLYIPVPEGMTFKQEIADDDGRVMSVGFYLDKPGYEMYGLFSNLSNITTEQGLEQIKKDMVASSVKDITVGGYRGFEGLVNGPKTRYLTVIVKDGKKITFSTIPPTEENKSITDQLFSSFSFQ